MVTITRKKAIFKNRKSKKLMRFVNGNSEYIRSDTIINCNAIIKFLKEDYKRCNQKRRKFCISELSQATKIRPESISSAIRILCFRPTPLIRMFVGAKYELVKLPDGKEKMKIKTMTMTMLRKSAKL